MHAREGGSNLEAEKILNAQNKKKRNRKINRCSNNILSLPVCHLSLSSFIKC